MFALNLVSNRLLLCVTSAGTREAVPGCLRVPSSEAVVPTPLHKGSLVQGCLAGGFCPTPGPGLRAPLHSPEAQVTGVLAGHGVFVPVFTGNSW